MENYLFYIGKSALAAGAFYLLFLALFQHQKHFRFNRLYLPVSLALSFVIPLITFTKIQYVEAAPVAANSMAFLPEVGQTYEAPVFQMEWYHYLFGIYMLGVAGFLCYLLLGHAKAISIIRKSRLKKLFSIKINVTKKDVHPFSFFHKIVLSEKTLKNPNLQMIVEHENIHVKEKHTFDILFAELLFLLQWFNPFAWLIKDAIKNNLEYKTDQQLTETHNPQVYQLAMVGLADKKGVAPFLTALNGSQLKNRIIMMKKKTENKYALIKQFLVLPLLAVLVMGLSNREVKTEIVPAENQVEILSIENVIKGKVTDAKGDPVSGATVIVKGKTVGTISDTEGKYELKLENENETLVFMAVGFEEIQIPVKEKNRIDVQFKGENTIRVNTVSTKTFTNENKNTVTGKVTDQNGDPISGATVIIKGTTTGTITNRQGNYEIQLDNENNETLVFSMVGYEVKEVSVKGKEKIDVELTADKSAKKKEKVVIGYPSKEAEEKGGAIRLDGNQENPPLYIVDGKEVDDITNLDPADIESIEVLKDKSATDLYGEKGKNGVICIETKFKENLNDKLIIVDGKEYDGEINDISPDEIASISVLKEKSATEVYGAKGKNGVIIIETKKEDNKEALYFLDGKRIGVNEANNYQSNRQLVKEIVTLSEAEARLKYGSAGKNGAVEIYMKKNPTTVDEIFSSKSVKEKPLVIVDGERFYDINQVDPAYIRSVNVLKDEAAREKYGDLGKNGVIEVTLKQPDELTQNKIPVVLNGKTTGKKLNEIDRDLIENIKRLEPEEATKKYGDFGKFGVLEVSSRNVYTDKVTVKSSKEIENEKIDTELKLRKFIAKEIKYPVKAQEANIEKTVFLAVKVDSNGKIEKISENSTKLENHKKTDFQLDEVVVVAYKSDEVVALKSTKEAEYSLVKEAKNVVGKFPEIGIDKFRGKTIGVTVKFVLQE